MAAHHQIQSLLIFLTFSVLLEVPPLWVLCWSHSPRVHSSYTVYCGLGDALVSTVTSSILQTLYEVMK